MTSLTHDDNSPKNLINRTDEMMLSKASIDALLGNKFILSTPILNFFGIDGIGKTRILQEIENICIKNDLPCIKLDENQTQLAGIQNVSKISRAILQQTNKYRQKSQKRPPVRKGDPHGQTVEAIKALLENKPLVILLDAIDTANEALVNWIKMTLRDLIENDNLFVVLTSKQRIVFEKDWFMARKLTPF